MVGSLPAGGTTPLSWQGTGARSTHPACSCCSFRRPGHRTSSTLPGFLHWDLLMVFLMQGCLLQYQGKLYYLPQKHKAGVKKTSRLLSAASCPLPSPAAHQHGSSMAPRTGWALQADADASHIPALWRGRSRHLENHLSSLGSLVGPCCVQMGFPGSAAGSGKPRSISLGAAGCHTMDAGLFASAMVSSSALASHLLRFFP